MRASVDTWTEADGTGVSVAAASPYLAPVSLALLESAETHRLELLALCEARGLSVDANASKAALRARLVSFNLSTRNVWCSRVQLLAKHVCHDALVDRAHMLPFQAAIAHRAPVPASFEAPSLVTRDPPHFSWAPSFSVGASPPVFLPPTPTPTAALPDKQQMMATAEAPSSSPPPLPPPPPSLPLPTPPSLGSTARPPRRLHSPALPATPHLGTPPTSSLSSVPDVPASTGVAGPAQFAYELARSLHERDLQTQRQEHAVSAGLQELQTAVVSLGGAHQSAAYSQTVQLTRMEHTLVGLERARTGAIVRPRSPTQAGMTPRKKRPKRGSARAVELLTEASGPGRAPGTSAVPPAVGAACAASSGDAEPPSAEAPALPTRAAFIPLVHGLMMEPELLSDTMGTAPLFTQLTYILRLAHVSPREPGIFGSYAVKRLHSVAQGRVEEAAAARGEPSGLNLEKAAKIDNVIANKADIYMRILWWVHSVLPEKLGGEAQAATVEVMRATTLATSDVDKLSAALDEQTAFLSKTGFKAPVKMTYSALRKVLNKLAVHERAVSRVEHILSSSPFKERLAVTVQNIGRAYLEPTTPPP